MEAVLKILEVVTVAAQNEARPPSIKASQKVE